MAQLILCTELSSEKVASLLRHSFVEVVEANYSGVIVVRSFKNDGQEYPVSLSQASAISFCSCSYMSDGKSVCKHMFLAQKVFGYSISYDTRLSKILDFNEASLPDPTAKPSAETEARPEANDHDKALVLEQVGFLKSLANGFSRLNEKEIEALNNINAQIARLKRCRDSNDRSWSKRQRR